MALRPIGLRTLVARAFEELDRNQSIFDLPMRAFVFPNTPVEIHGRRALAPLGPSAGPHTQMAQNIVLCWLAGARVIELKTVQILDTLKIPRPCIDARTVGYNVEWSQELTIEQSLEEYVKASMLIDILAHYFGVNRGTLFDVSVGYDLAGIRSERMVGFLRGLIDARPTVSRLRRQLPAQLRDLHFTTKIASGVTLSTFHGCPSTEIESIAEFLGAELGLDVTLKLNPTLLGRRGVFEILYDRLGYTDVYVPASAFDNELQFHEMLFIVDRCNVAVKLTNTLVVENRSDFLPPSEKIAYLSGAPLHVMAMHLVQRFRRAMPKLPISFSAGIDRSNYADAVRLGLKPVTVCTDLLKPGGYARLPRYAAELAQRMDEEGVQTIEQFATGSIDDYIEQLDHEPRYRREHVARAPCKRGAPLGLYDCATCDLCIEVCPNDALFRVPSRGAQTKKHQIVCFADVCNDCGNCEVFCPDLGAPNRLKARVFGDGRFVPEEIRGAVLDPARANYINALALEKA
jgi:putative selenate reductase